MAEKEVNESDLEKNSDLEVKEEEAVEENEKKKKVIEPGIIYLSTIPPSMSMLKIRHIFSRYGELGRMFLQPKDKRSKKKRKVFSEGWIEFKNKKIAKKVATNLNNTQVGGKRRDKDYDTLWNIKYLHRFRWTHLNERLAYEKAVHQQRMRTEIAQVKRETNHFVKSVEKNKKLNKVKKTLKKSGKEWVEKVNLEPKQTLTTEDLKNGSGEPPQKKTRLLHSVFGAKKS